MYKTKNLILAVILILISIIVMSLIPTEAEAAIYDDTIRLHILANSDTEEDQRLKLEIRDKLLEKYSAELSKYNNVAEAKKELAELITSIEKDVEKWIEDSGFSYSTRVILDEEWYETREYESGALPKGYYTSLRILIGNGEGKNWWCVMYPPLCVDIATEKAPADDANFNLTKEETTLISSGGYSIKFKLLEIISDIFH